VCVKKRMKTDGQAFLEYMEGASMTRFELRFSRISMRLDLGAALDARELSLLYEAAFLATLCNISFNGLGGCEGEIKPDREFIRTLLEREYMRARSLFFGCKGIGGLSKSQRQSVQAIFLKVCVADQNLG